MAWNWSLIMDKIIVVIVGVVLYLRAEQSRSSQGSIRFQRSARLKEIIAHRSSCMNIIPGHSKQRRLLSGLSIYSGSGEKIRVTLHFSNNTICPSDEHPFNKISMRPSEWDEPCLVYLTRRPDTLIGGCQRRRTVWPKTIPHLIVASRKGQLFA